MMKEWRGIEPIGRGRLGEIAMRIAYITSAMNHDPEMTPEAMEALWNSATGRNGFGQTTRQEWVTAMTPMYRCHPWRPGEAGAGDVG